MVRRFAVIGHRAPSSGKINLNDLAGSSGRLDVLARAVNTGLFLSHGIRDDTDIVLHLMGGPGPPRRIWFQGSRLRGVHPDERAIAGQIAKALRDPVPAIGQQVELHKGLWHSGGDIGQTIAEWDRDGVRTFVLDACGERYDSEAHHSDSVGFILSDDQPFSDSELGLMGSIEKVSLGEKWLQGHSCIAIIHHSIDS
jgi:tRNA (pseudouridine54-N1)-methyltransferase